MLSLHSVKVIEENPHFKENCHNVPSRHISILVPLLCRTKHAQMPRKFTETGNIDTSLVCTPCSSALVTSRSMNLLNLPSRSQIIFPQPINEQVFSPRHKETLSNMIFKKIGGRTEIEYFQRGPRSSN